LKKLHVLVVVLLAATTGTSAAAQEQQSSRTTRATFRTATESREITIYRPSTGRARALVLMLHGCTQSADDFARGTRMNDAAEKGGFIVVYAEQPAVKHVQKCWNWYVPEHSHRDQGEVALLAGLVDSLAKDAGIPPANVAAVGMSAGGAMAANLVASYPEKFGALAMHSGIPAFAAGDIATALKVMREGSEAGSALGGSVAASMGTRLRAIPVIAIHGAADKVVAPPNLDRIVEQWTTVNAQGAPVERHLLDGVGHAWSGGAADGSYTAPAGPDATGLIVDFFRRVGVIPKG
jgi:poly(hydroxyalkanoate) depolymerase family esterase